MGCGCNKNSKKTCSGPDCLLKQKEITIEHLVEPISVPNINKSDVPVWIKQKGFNMNNNENNDDFKKREIESKNPISKGFSMATSFISAIASKGLNEERVNVPLKQLRVLSCFGNKDSGGVLPPCEYLQNSVTPGKFFCGGCGCGDKPLTWLNGTADEYSKLDYPKLACPLQMPGFSNYKESLPEESIQPVTRRAYIEKMKFEELNIVPVTMPQTPSQNS